MIWATGVIGPLILAPYVNRVLGPGGVGLIVFCQAFAAYPTIAMEYGFQLGGARGVATRAEDPASLRRYVSASWYARLILGGVALPATLVVGLAFPEVRDIRVMLVLLLSALVLGGSSEWYFRGCGRLGTSAVWFVIGRSLTIPLTFLLVDGPGQFLRVLAIGVIGNAVPFVVLAAKMLREQPLQPPVWIDIRAILMEQRWFFMIILVQSLGTSLTTILLTSMASPEATGYWGVAQRIQGPFWAVVAPFLTATFPRVASEMRIDPMNGRRLARRFTALSVAGAVGTGIVLLVLSRPLVLLLAGEEFIPSIVTLRLLCVYLPLIAVSTALSQIWLLPLNKEEYSLYITLCGSLVSVGAFVMSWRNFGHNAMVLSLVAGELTRVSLYAVTLRRLKVSCLH